MFGETSVFMFDPGIGSLHLTASAPLKSSEMPGSFLVALWLAKVPFYFNPDGCCLFYNDCDHSLSRDVPIQVFIGEKVMFVVKIISCLTLFSYGWTHSLDVAGSSGTWPCWLSPLKVNFVYDPGICSIFIYILEDKDGFKRVGKRIEVMVMIRSIRDGQMKICMISIEEGFGSMTTWRNETTCTPTIFIFHGGVPKADKMLIFEVGKLYSSQNRRLGVGHQLCDEMTGPALLKYLDYEGLASEFVVFRPMCSILMTTLQILGFYHSWINRTFSVILNMSIYVAMHSLLAFYHVFAKELKPHNPLAKFIGIKGIVFFSFWKSTVHSILAAVGIIKPHLFRLDVEHIEHLMSTGHLRLSHDDAKEGYVNNCCHGLAALCYGVVISQGMIFSSIATILGQCLMPIGVFDHLAFFCVVALPQIHTTFDQADTMLINGHYMVLSHSDGYITDVALLIQGLLFVFYGKSTLGLVIWNS